MSETAGKIMDPAVRLAEHHDLPDEELYTLITERDEATAQFLKQEARALCERMYGRVVYIRGLIEFTNYCKNDCYYCGIRRSNREAERYRLTEKRFCPAVKPVMAWGFGRLCSREVKIPTLRTSVSVP